MSLTPGTRLGPYEVVSAIGAGGMGEVYRAKDTNLNRDVALKILPESFASDADRVARFKREAQVLASLNHPNIAAIYGIEASGVQGPTSNVALVMELVEGEDLSAHIARGAIPLSEALPIARQIADALEAAHEQGIIHRDLKPANIKVRNDGTVKVLDFGLAKAMDPAGASSVEPQNSPTLTARATAMGMIIGTAAYMSPEQAKGRAVDKRADIWAFGVVLYEMLTGERAFKGDDVSDTLVSVLRDTPDYAALPADTPPRLRRLLERCLDRDIKMRLRDIGEARVEIVKIESGAPDTSTMSAASGIAAGPSPRSSWWDTRVIMVALAVAALAAVGTWMLKPAPVAPRAVVAQFAVSLPANATYTRTQSHVIAISPDGSRIAYIAGAQLFVRGLGDLEPTVVAGVRDPNEVFFSPDGQWLGFYTSARIWRVPVTGGAPLVICEAQVPRGASWAGDEILFAQDAGIMRVAATGGTPEVLVKADAGKLRLANPVRLPGQGGVLFGRLNGSSWDEAEIVVAAPATGAERILVRGGSDARLLSTGHLVFGRGGDLLAVPFDPTALATMGEPVTLIRGVSRMGGNIVTSSPRQYGVSDTGTLVYVSGGADEQTDLVWMDRQGRPELIAMESEMSYPRISPDGRRIAYGAGVGGNQDIFVLEWARKARSRLTFDLATDTSPMWTPDSKRIVYGSSRDGGAVNLYWQAADGTGAAERLTTNKNQQFPYAITRDGQTVLYIEQSPKTDFDIYAVALTGDRKPRALLATAFDERRPALSPDGKWMAYQSNESGSFEIFVRPFPDVEGGRWQVSAGGGASPIWGTDGREIYYRLGPSLMRVSVSTTPVFSAAAPTVVLKHSLVADVSGMQYDLTPDGKRFVMNQVHAGQNQASQYNVVLNWLEDVRARVPRKR